MFVKPKELGLGNYPSPVQDNIGLTSMSDPKNLGLVFNQVQGGVRLMNTLDLK
jgi:hypothetical protein